MARSSSTFDRPAIASDPALPKPVHGQQETNRESDDRQSSSAKPAEDRSQDDMDVHATAFEFGWQSRLQYGRAAATPNLTFENVEPALEKLWSLRQAAKHNQLPWQAARETARDAWNQVYDALAGDSQAKTKTNG
jgi:hypothetical protein